MCFYHFFNSLICSCFIIISRYINGINFILINQYFLCRSCNFRADNCYFRYDQHFQNFFSEMLYKMMKYYGMDFPDFHVCYGNMKIFDDVMELYGACLDFFYEFSQYLGTFNVLFCSRQ